MLKKLIILTLILSPIFFAQAAQPSGREQLLSVRILKEGSKISIETINLSYGYKSKDAQEHNYILRSLDKGNNIINELKFDFPIIFHAPSPDWFDPVTGEQIYVPEFNPNTPQRTTLNLPFSTNIKYIATFDKTGQKELTKANIEDYLKKTLDKLKKNEEINKKYAQRQELKKLEKRQQTKATSTIKATIEDKEKIKKMSYIDYGFFALLFILFGLGWYFWEKYKE